MDLIKKGIPLFSKKIFHYPFWIGVIAISFLFGSCHRGQMKFTFLKLNSADLFKYYNAPGFNKLVFQFVIPDLNSNKKNVKLIGYALDKNYDPIGNPFILEYATDSAAKVFEGPGIYGNLELTKTALDGLIKLKDSTFQHFDYLLFAPKQVPSSQITYNLYLRPALPGSIGAEQEPPSLNPSPPAKPGLNLND
jgi:hypothetical protein